MIKMSEYTPSDLANWSKPYWRAIFPENLVAVVLGEADVGMAFSKLPFDHPAVHRFLPAVGRQVMRARRR